MARPRKNPSNLPPRVYMKGKVYYYVSPENRWIRLADNLPAMYRALSDILAAPPCAPMERIFSRYESDVLPGKAAKTQQEYLRQLGMLRTAFGHMHPDDIRPPHVAGYLDKRGAKIAANREVALLSAVFTKAIRWGLATSNPCRGVERNKEKPDSRDVSDTEFFALYRMAPKHIRDAMALAYLTGQRQGDILKLTRGQLTPEGIFFQQSKTGKRLIVCWTPALTRAVNRAMRNAGGTASLHWVIHKNGRPVTSNAFKKAWQTVMRRALESGEVAERFTFRAIRAKSRGDATDKRLLGHANPEAMARIYQRKPERVQPVR